jgi:hypothetical protein
MPRLVLASLLLVACFSTSLCAQPANTTDRSWELQYPRPIVNLIYGRFSWKSLPVLIWPARGDNDAARGRGIKEPTAVFYQNKWHLFATVRNEKPTHQIVYLSFADWNEADKSPRHILKLDENHSASPQVFYFEPQRKWYLIYQIANSKTKPEIQPVYSTTDDISNPDSWSRPQPLFATQPENVRLWTDFWVICTEERAFVFFSSRDGNLWRSGTRVEDFPGKWSQPQNCLESDVLQGARVYHLRGFRKYLTIIEAQETGRRYCKAFWADYPNGRWDDLAVSEKRPFAGKKNIKQDPQWIEQVSRGEILRSSYDQRMEIDPLHIQFLFAGIDEYDKTDRGYGQIPWRIGLLEPQ